MMEEAFKHARTAERMKAYHEPRYDDITPINVIYSQHKANHEYECNFRGNNKSHNFKPEEKKNNQALGCYYCNKPHYITNCMKFTADKDKYRSPTQKVSKKYLERIRQKNVSINKTALDNDPKIDQRYAKRGSRTVMQLYGRHRFGMIVEINKRGTSR